MWSNTRLWFCSQLLIVGIWIFWGCCCFQHRSQKRSLHYWYFQPSLNICSLWYSWLDSLLSRFGEAWSSAAGSEEGERLLRTTLGIHISRCSAQPLCQFLLRNEWPDQKNSCSVWPESTSAQTVRKLNSMACGVLTARNLQKFGVKKADQVWIHAWDGSVKIGWVSVNMTGNNYQSSNDKPVFSVNSSHNKKILRTPKCLDHL